MKLIFETQCERDFEIQRVTINFGA